MHHSAQSANTNAKSRTLYIHIGHGKTGTKWIQKILGLNADLLLEHDVYYPLLPADNPASLDLLTWGNGRDIFDPEADINAILDSYNDHPDKSLILSSEKISNNLYKAIFKTKESLALDLNTIRKKGFSTIHILLLIREPVDFLISLHKQDIKMNKIHASPMAISVDYYKRENLFFANKLMELMHAEEDCKVTLLNYDKIKEDMLPSLEYWLGLPQIPWKKPQFEKANRSLTFEEAYTVYQINGEARSKIVKLTNQWISKAPNIGVQKMYPSLDIQKAIWQKNENEVELINQYLETAQRITFVPREESIRPSKLQFEYAQIDILLKHFTEEITILEKENESLRETLKNLQNNNLKKVIKKLLRRLKNKLNIRWAQTKTK